MKKKDIISKAKVVLLIILTTGVIGLGVGFLQVNTDLQETETKLKATQVLLVEEQNETVILKEDNTVLSKKNIKVTEENVALQEQVDLLLAEIETYKATISVKNGEKQDLENRLEEATKLGSTGNPFPVTVWASGSQAEIDACKGAVDVSVQYETAAIAEHSHCGGDDFPKTVGSYVVIGGGQYAGVYRVGGIMVRLNANIHTTADVPKNQADLIYQTCLNGATDMGFFKLTRIT